MPHAALVALVTQEVRRTVRRCPRWACYREDLLQDGYESGLRGLRRGATGGALRVWIRGGVLRAGMGYFGVSERSGLTPMFVGVEVAGDLAAPVADPAAARVAALVVDASPRARRAMLVVMDGGTVKDAAVACGVSRQTLYADFARLAERAAA